ncbi:hypothetical protein [Corynebacterium aquilae]|uniref:Uncharacterized protein n=1 Tax=Corynebacterium aquilae DSM 44791 TaxID=1431546 RepID=A0A1L7CE86_9CORY|nr:hypothetical protein [Corynebacterium aquilae]APT84161.1 hypothetical protein CAQU_02725 [Corynebacterium aquilae DSM 44791]
MRFATSSRSRRPVVGAALACCCVAALAVGCSTDTSSSPTTSATTSSTSGQTTAQDPTTTTKPAGHATVNRARPLPNIALGETLDEVRKQLPDLTDPKPFDRQELMCVDTLCPPAGELTAATSGAWQLIFADGALERIVSVADSDAALEYGIAVGTARSVVRQELGSPSWVLTLDEPVELYSAGDSRQALLIRYTTAADSDEQVVESISYCNCLPPREDSSMDNPPAFFPAKQMETDAAGGFGTYAAPEQVAPSSAPAEVAGHVDAIKQDITGKPRTAFLVGHPFTKDGKISAQWVVKDATTTEPVSCWDNPGVSGIPAEMSLCGKPQARNTINACMLSDQSAYCVTDPFAGVITRMPYVRATTELPADHFDPYAPYAVQLEDGAVSTASGATSGGAQPWFNDAGRQRLNPLDATWQFDGGEASPKDVLAAVWLKWAH